LAQQYRPANLIEERLEDVVVPAIEQRDTAGGVAKHLARREASESAADDDYMWIGHVPLLVNAQHPTSNSQKAFPTNRFGSW
jgi:hypothetical protein